MHSGQLGTNRFFTDNEKQREIIKQLLILFTYTKWSEKKYKLI